MYDRFGLLLFPETRHDTGRDDEGFFLFFFFCLTFWLQIPHEEERIKFISMRKRVDAQTKDFGEEEEYSDDSESPYNSE